MILVYTGSSASAAMGLFILFVGYLTCTAFNKKGKYHAFVLFNIVFALTTAIIIVRYDYMTFHPDTTNFFKSGIDQSRLYVESGMASGYTSFIQLALDTFNEYYENQGYYLYLRSVAFIGNQFFDGNHEVLQLLGSSLFGCILALVVFKILLLYFAPRKALSYSLIFFCLSPLLQYSVYLLRDIHITLIYATVTYIVVTKYKPSNYPWLFILAVTAWLVRPQHGMFTMVFIALYYYKGSKKNAGVLIVGMVSLVAVVSIGLMNQVYDELSDTLTFYEARTGDIAKNNISFAFISKLPPPFKQIGQVVIYTFFPVNVWNQLMEGFDHPYAFINTLMQVVSKVFWFYVMWLLLKWIMFKKALERIDWTYKWLFAIAVVFYLLNASDMSVRRTMCVYPMLFAMFVQTKEYYVGKRQYNKDLVMPTIFFIVTSSLYTIIK